MPGVTGSSVRIPLAALLVAAGTLLPAQDAPLVYENDFEGGVGSEWSQTRTDVSPVLNRRFLGQFQTENVTLTLKDFPLQSTLTVAFDLYVIGAWDGNKEGPGPSFWEISVDGGPLLLRTTFSNIDGHAGLRFNQSYPSPYPAGDNPPYTGAVERNTMGFSYSGDLMDAVYKLSFTFPHDQSSLTLRFYSSLEYYGLDNIRVHGTPVFGAEFEYTSPHCVDLIINNTEPIRGGEVGLVYDQRVVSLESVRPGPDFPRGGEMHLSPDAENHCPGDEGGQSGLTVGWFNSVTGGAPTPAGRHRMVRICSGLADGVPIGTCSPLKLVDCLGVAPAPIRNVVTDLTGRSRLLQKDDGEVCIQPDLPLRRGDANSDGIFDISDAIFILGCLFLGTDCPECLDAADTNDDGDMNIGDPVYLLNWRFSSGPPPADPFVACGTDPTADALEECGAYPSCP